MKKSLLLFVAAMLVGGAANAQTDNTLQFVDASGNVVEDGATVNGEVEYIDAGAYGGYYQVNSGLYVKNNSSETVGVSVAGEITRLDNGRLDCCFPSKCRSLYSVGAFDFEEDADVLEDSAEPYPFSTEWFPESNTSYGQCTATFRLVLREVVYNSIGGIQIPAAGDVIAQGPSVTVNFVFDEESAGITGIETVEDNEPVGYYTLDGQKLSAPRKGAVNIVKYANGKTAKTFVK